MTNLLYTVFISSISFEVLLAFVFAYPPLTEFLEKHDKFTIVACALIVLTILCLWATVLLLTIISNGC